MASVCLSKEITRDLLEGKLWPHVRMSDLETLPQPEGQNPRGPLPPPVLTQNASQAAEKLPPPQPLAVTGHPYLSA